MLINLKTIDFVSVVQAVVKTSNQKKDDSYTSKVRIHACRGVLSLYSSNGQVSQWQKIAIVDHNFLDEFDVCVSSALLLNAVARLADFETLTLSLDESKLTVRSGRFRATLSTTKGSEFPIDANDVSKDSLEIHADKLASLISDVEACVATNDVRQMLNGVYLKKENSLMMAYGTNGHLLGYSELPINAQAGKDFDVIIPQRTISDLLSYCSDKAHIKLCVSHGKIYLSDDSSSFGSSLVDAKYPDVSRFFDHKYSVEAQIHTGEFSDSIHRVSSVTQTKHPRIDLSGSGSQLKIESASEKANSMDCINNCSISGQIDIRVSPDYLQKALRTLKTDSVTLHFDNSSSQIELSSPNARQRFVVQPMRK